MDKEMMEKVNEVMKAHGKRELSMDEMDQVSGGLNGDYYNGLTEQEVCDLYYSLTECVGFDVAYQMFMKQTGYDYYNHNAFGNGATDMEKMAIVLTHYIKHHDHFAN